MEYDVALVRHGQTPGYSNDMGLTELGESQSRTKGAQLAAGLEPGTTVAIPHALSARATATAVALRAGLVEKLGGDRVDGTVVDPITPNPWFENMRFALRGEVREPTTIAHERLQLLPPAPGAGPLPGWAAEFDRFDTTFSDAAGGPIDYWIANTTLHFEPPQVTVYRLWRGITESGIDRPRPLLVVACTHSAVIRAFAAAAVGHDPGEPDHLEHVWVRVRLSEGRATVSYRAHEVDVEIPADLPPWIDRGWFETHD